MQQKIIKVYKTTSGKEPFTAWLRKLKDPPTRVRIRRRLERLEQGHYGDVKPVGEGVFELRLFFGAGYRIYFAEDGDTLIVLLCGGAKGNQARDIEQAKQYWRHYQEDKP